MLGYGIGIYSGRYENPLRRVYFLIRLPFDVVITVAKEWR
jgi:hypothetical protein